MGNRQYANAATSILAGTITSTSTVVPVSTGQGALFPNPTGTEYFYVTVQDTSGNIEYMKCTAVSGDNLTVVRGQAGSTAQGFTANLARVEQRIISLDTNSWYQKDGDTLTGPMNGGGQTVTDIVIGSGSSVEGATEIVNTPIRGVTGITTNQIVVPTNGSRATAGGLPILCEGDALPVFAVGMIMAFNGAIGNIPTGWHICDGTSGTPDLRDSFILGAGNTYTLGETGSLSGTVSSVSAGTPAFSPITLTAANLPPHDHPFDYFFGNSAGPIVNPGGSATGNYFTGSGGVGTRNSYAGSPGPGSSTPITPSGTALAAHTHSASVGPYYALYYIQYIG